MLDEVDRRLLKKISRRKSVRGRIINGQAHRSRTATATLHFMLKYKYDIKFNDAFVPKQKLFAKDKFDGRHVWCSVLSGSGGGGRQ
jgi:hypothetical protein